MHRFGMSHRFFVAPQAIVNGRVQFDAALSHQIAHVLRMQPGARVTVLDNSGLEYEVELSEVRREGVVGQVCGQQQAETEAQVSLTLYAGVLKGEKFEWVLQKATELGVRAFVPLISERTVVRNAAHVEKKRDRWERIIREAAEQSGRARLPTIASPMSLEAALAQSAAQNDRSLFPCLDVCALSLADALHDAPPSAHIGVFIGPEGGFSPQEATLARENGLHRVSLGPRVLRAETAGIAVIALTLFALGEV
ncbi:MAG: 16S rRNA (uracil(1498)-N(3))-methyltransferase [Anaerolineae bacterium]|nr:16S rRNA (uracil(1498)-N(3))-methyltransferase [Anaerolineae bacterium]